MRHRLLLAGLVTATVLGLACSESDITNEASGQGTLSVRLRDHPFWFDSVAAVNVYVVRVDARLAEADSAEADSDMDDDRVVADHGGEDSEHHDDIEEHEHHWVTIAEPNKVFNLLDLQGGVTAFLGEAPVDTGDFKAIRLIIDPDSSTIVLKNGTVLSAPFVRFRHGEHAGISVVLARPVHVRHHARSIVIIDFDLEQSFEMLGSGIGTGLFFHPRLRGDW